MCGIGGLYNTAYSETDLEDLFWLIGDRGLHASGVAFKPNKSDKVHVSKWAKSSRYVVARGVSKFIGTDNLYAILHARYTTQGSTKNNNNNHPINYDHIVLTHNGVIDNDGEILRDLGRMRRYEVDTECIAAALAVADVEYVMENIEGSMSLVWVDRRNPEVVNLITNGRNPLHMARLDDGGIAWSSLPYMIDHLGISDRWEAQPYRLYQLHPDGSIEHTDMPMNIKLW